MNKQGFDYDFVVIGSGFGGSVSALRLSEKGYRVAVLEKGKRWGQEDFPKTNWDLRKYLWLPSLGCYGFQMLTQLKHVMILHGGGVGGGSLVCGAGQPGGQSKLDHYRIVRVYPVSNSKEVTGRGGRGGRVSFSESAGFRRPV